MCHTSGLGETVGDGCGGGGVGRGAAALLGNGAAEQCGLSPSVRSCFFGAGELALNP